MTGPFRSRPSLPGIGHPEPERRLAMTTHGGIIGPPPSCALGFRPDPVFSLWRLSPLILLWLSATMPGLGSLPVVEAAEKVATKMTVKDVLTRPKQSVRLEARLVTPGVLRESGLGGERLEFFVGGVRAGAAMTGGDGRAYLEFTTRMRGNQIIRVKLAGSTRVQDTEATGNLASWERRRPIVLVELAALLDEGKLPVGLPSLPLQLGLESLPGPATGCVENLTRLTKFYFNVVYVSRTGIVQMEALRDWLAKHKFPPGVPRVVKPGKRALDALIEEFAEKGFREPRAGVGRTQDFADTLAERRVKVVILSEDGPEKEYPRRTEWAKDWVEVRRKVQG